MMTSDEQLIERVSKFLLLPRWSCSSDNVNDADIATMLRAVINNKNKLLLIDPDLPFPQRCNICKFVKGRESEKQLPMPVAVLIYFWDECTGFTGECEKCDGQVYAVGFNGGLSVGSLFGYCKKCGYQHLKWIGGIGGSTRYMRHILKPSGYRLGVGRFGGCFQGEKEPLYNALVKIGEKDLPSIKWLRKKTNYNLKNQNKEK